MWFNTQRGCRTAKERVVSEIVISSEGHGLVRVDLWAGTEDLLVEGLADFTLFNVLIRPLLLVVNQKLGHGSVTAKIRVQSQASSCRIFLCA